MLTELSLFLYSACPSGIRRMNAMHEVRQETRVQEAEVFCRILQHLRHHCPSDQENEVIHSRLEHHALERRPKEKVSVAFCLLNNTMQARSTGGLASSSSSSWLADSPAVSNTVWALIYGSPIPDSRMTLSSARTVRKDTIQNVRFERIADGAISNGM